MGRTTTPDGFSTGSVRKHGKRWQAVIDKRKDGERSQLVKTLPVECKPGKGDNTGKKAALAELAAWRAELVRTEEEAVSAPKVPERGTVTVWDYCNQHVDDLAARNVIEPSTVSDYRRALRRLNADIRQTALRDLTPAQIERWEVEMLNTQGLASVTVKKSHRVLKQCLMHAVDMEEIDRDPTARVKPPKTEAKQPNALDATARARLVAALGAMEPTPLKMAVSLALYTGMRAGEVCALQWKTVDLEASSLWVHSAIGRGEGGTYTKEPKTKGSRRDIPIPAPLLDTLRERRRAMSEECNRIGASLSPDCYVCGRIDGAYLNPTTLTKQWMAVADLFGLVGTQGERCTFHDLRHTFATAAISGGADVKTVSSILGHSNAAMTLNTYASADPDAKRAAMERIGETMGAPVAEVIEFRPTGTGGN